MTKKILSIILICCIVLLAVSVGTYVPRSGENNLSDKDISYLAKIVSVCDIFDAVTSRRSYHTPLSGKKGFELLKDEVKKYHVSKEIVDIFDKQMLYYIKNTYVTLNNGELCMVISNTTCDKKPLVIRCLTKQVYDLNKSSLYIV